jgi:hypothetical protein
MYQLERIASRSLTKRPWRSTSRSSGTAAAVPILADFEVHNSAENWRGQMQSLAFFNSMKAHGSALQGGRGAWINAHAQSLSLVSPLNTGDWFTMIGNASPVSRLIGGVIYRDGTTLHYISSNAGGVRLPARAPYASTK